MKYKLKEHVTDEMLIECGFEKSHVAVFPTALVKIVDDKHVIEVCMEEPSYNMWTGEDWKDTKILKLWKCHVVKQSTSKIILEPNVKKHWYYEKYKFEFDNKITPYIQDLIELGYVEVVE